ncbi:hypothetical protein ACGFR6_27510 [Streptomyces sp. NPDC048567]|uniref:hypothetical protein n=1 Tax=Streptomyces sp. NPDC048567 TaxID=3365570 RepID=UPI00371BAE3F
MTTQFPPIDRDKNHLTAVDEEAVRLADALEDHPGTSDVTDADAAGDIVFTAAGHSWVLDFQAGPDGEVFHDPTGAPADGLATDVLHDVVVPALLAHPAYPAATVNGNTLTVHLASGRRFTLALTPAA